MRLIDADDYIARLDHVPMVQEAIKKSMDCMPTIEERKKGKWINRSLNIMYPEWERYTCSVCGKHSNNYDFCPHCGARMTEGGEDA